MLHLPTAARKRPATLAEDVVVFQGFPHGLNTSVAAFQLTVKEMSECVNWKIKANGQLESRKAITKYTGSAMASAPRSLVTGIIGGTQRDIIACDDGEIYYLNGTTPTLIGTVGSNPFLFMYDDKCVICDGSYLKYIDGVTSVKIAYDAGDDGTIYDNYSGETDSSIAVGDATNTRVGVAVTTPTWDSGYTIPITKVTFRLKKTGSPTGTMTCKLRKVSDDSVLASKDLAQDAADISATSEFVDVLFTSSDITTEMSTGVAYIVTLEYSGGDASNYISVFSSDDGTYTDTGRAYSGSWSTETGKNPIMKVYPGVPPKASFGWVSKRRPWVSGDPDNPGYVWYGALSVLDWSTTDSGGYLSVVDDNNESFSVGAGQDLYGEMFVYGTETQPYICRLEGTTPADFTLPLMFQKGWATPRTLLNIGNDLWGAIASGVDSLSGVQQYGDIRSSSESEKVKDRFETYWDTTKAFAGYYPDDGQYWVAFNHASYKKVLVGHTKAPYRTDVSVSYPWTEYSLPADPSAFGTLSIGYTIGSTDKYLYTFDSSVSKDLDTTDIDPTFKSAYVELPFRSVDLVEFQVMASSLSSGTMKIDIYRNGETQVPAYQYTYELSDSLTVNELTMDINDWVSIINNYAVNTFFDMNLNVFRFQVGLSDVALSIQSLFFNGCIVKYRKLKRL